MWGSYLKVCKISYLKDIHLPFPPGAWPGTWLVSHGRSVRILSSGMRSGRMPGKVAEIGSKPHSIWSIWSVTGRGDCSAVQRLRTQKLVSLGYFMIWTAVACGQHCLWAVGVASLYNKAKYAHFQRLWKLIQILNNLSNKVAGLLRNTQYWLIFRFLSI